MSFVTGEFWEACGVIHLAHLRDGKDFTGQARRVARRLDLVQTFADRSLFAAHGGIEEVTARLREKRGCASSNLTRAENRLLLINTIDGGQVAPTEVRLVDATVGLGLYTTAPLARGAVVGEYTGVLRRYREEDRTNAYLAVTPAYGPIDNLIIDGRDEGNVTRFINHAERRANVITEFVFHARRWHRVMRTTRAVDAGEQLLTDYGEAYWRDRVRPLEL